MVQQRLARPRLRTGPRRRPVRRRSPGPPCGRSRSSCSGTPRAAATGEVTDEMWQRMQDPVVIAPRRSFGAYADHTEMYLPEQVVVFFVGDRPALISHMSSGTGEQWCEEVTISPGEMGNEDGTEPLQRGECGVSTTPGGVYRYYRRVEGVRQSALGGMWNPVYFNYGIAIHGALNVPLRAGVARLHPHPAGDLRDVPAARPRRRPGLRLRRRARAGGLRRPAADVQLARPRRRRRPTVPTDGAAAGTTAPADPTLSRGAARRGGR